MGVKMNGSNLCEKSLRWLRLSFSSKVNRGSCIFSFAKTALKKNGAVSGSVKIVCLRVFVISIDLPYDLVSNIVVKPSCYLDVLDKLQNGYVGLLVLYLLLFLNLWFLIKM